MQAAACTLFWAEQSVGARAKYESGARSKLFLRCEGNFLYWLADWLKRVASSYIVLKSERCRILSLPASLRISSSI